MHPRPLYPVPYQHRGGRGAHHGFVGADLIPALAWAADGRTSSKPCTWGYCDANDARAWEGALKGRLLELGQRIPQVPLEQQGEQAVIAAKSLAVAAKKRLTEIENQFFCEGLSISCQKETNELISLQIAVNNAMDSLVQFGAQPLKRPGVEPPGAPTAIERGAGAVASAMVVTALAVGVTVVAVNYMKKKK